MPEVTLPRPVPPERVGDHGEVTSALLALLHLGALHPIEKGLTLVLAFGPFVVLAVVVAVRRRQDATAEAPAASEAEAAGLPSQPQQPTEQPQPPTD